MDKISSQKGKKELKSKSQHLCVYCGDKVVRTKKKVDFRWGERLSIFEDVPVDVCRGCGEEYYDAGVIEKMEQKAMSKKGVIKEIRVPVMSL